MLDERPGPLLRRLMQWLAPFRACFGHEAQQIALGQYLSGLLSDSARKSMQAMLARVTDAVRYQSFQQFITDAPWNAADVWRVLRTALPERAGALILDDTGFPKKGHESVGVPRQYTGTVGKIANCQVAVTATLWTGVRGWLVGAGLYLPQEWVTDREACEKVRIPESVVFQTKWEIALGLLHQAVAADLDVTTVLADAGYGDVTAFRAALHERGLAYAVGIASTTTVFRNTPQLIRAKRPGKAHAPRRPRPTLRTQDRSFMVSALAAGMPPAAWRRITWRNGTNDPRAARFTACRVTPAHEWYRSLAPEVWLLCERSLDGTYDNKYFLLHLPPRTGLARLVSVVPSALGHRAAI